MDRAERPVVGEKERVSQRLGRSGPASLQQTALQEPVVSRQKNQRIGRMTRWLSLGVTGLSAAVIVGCETDSFLDPSVVGRWEQTPVTMPILSSLDIIESSAASQSLAVTPVRPEDLEPDVQEYVLGPGDVVTVSVFELIVPGQTDQQVRRVDETGSIRLPVIGKVKAAGLSPSQLEEEIIDILERKGVLRDATVSVVVNQSGQAIYHIVGTPGEGLTRFGTYAIPQPQFRLLEAIALAGGVDDQTQTLLVFRQTPLTAEVAGTTVPAADQEAAPTAPATDDPDQLLNQLLEGGAPAPAPAGGDAGVVEDRPAPPSSVEAGLESAPSGATQWVYVDGKWVQAGGSPQVPAAVATNAPPDLSDELAGKITQRIIEVPYSRLLDGDMRYNVVIRPGDIIRVPSRNAGFVYIMGQSARPGTYTVPGENELTLKQLVAASGGLGGLANPRRVDLTRRIGDAQEATVRLDLKAIFDGTEPDIFLKENDLINVGTDFWAVPLAVVRNGFRVTYGFGFIADRNFGNDIFGAPPDSNN
jgi:polysaccharide export outer membrane protein